MKRKTFIASLALLAALPFVSCSKSESKGKLTIALLPKSKGNQYFVTCEKGARAAAAELNADFKFDGPINSDPAKQNEIVENWITDGVDVIAAACENKDSISTALRKAQAAGIKVVTYDADAQPALAGVGCTIAAGKVTLVLGPNGAGKSTDRKSVV